MTSSSRRRELSPIPEPPRDASPAMRSMLAAIKEALEVRLGRRGDPLEQALTKRDVIEAGLAKAAGAGGQDLAPVVTTPSEARIVPPVPLGFSAEGTQGGVHLTWENPFEAYNVHAYTEVWRGQTNEAAGRVLINSSRGATFFDRIPDDDAGDYWYWVRFVSAYNRMGPFSLPFKAGKPSDTQAILDRISGEIEQSDLSLAFQDEIGQLKASYVVKLDNEGYAAGFGLYNTGAFAEFAVLADRFSIGRPGMPKVRPFVVDDGTVYIDTAMIREASIESGQIGSLSFGKITGADGKPVTTLAGKLRADAIDVESLRVTDANFSGVLRSSQVASNGQPRWLLDKDGGMAINGSGEGGRMEIRDSIIRMYYPNGNLLMRMGMW